MKYTHLLLLVGLTFSANAMATSSTVTADWNFLSGSGDNNGISGSGINTSLSGSKNGVTLDITAWSSSLHNNVASCKDSDLQDQCIQRSQLTRYSGGLGVVNGDESDNSPNHAIDNNDQDYDMVLLTFSEAINISSLSTGWNYSYSGLSGTSYSSRTWNDAGASVMAFTDTGTAPPFSSTSNGYSTITWSDLTGAGWTNIGSDFSTNSSGDIAISSGNVFSKYWLVGAAHAVERNAGHITDHIKLAGITFAKNVNPPPPSTINAPATALMTFLLAGVVLYRRKK